MQIHNELHQEIHLLKLICTTAMLW